MAIEKLFTPPGRLVWGNPAKSFPKKDQKTKQPILKDGKPVEQWSFGIAIPKAEFNAKIWPLLQQEALSAYPHGVPPTFSWKFKDGDGVDRQGKPYNLREGYAGCFVLNIQTEAFAPPIFKLEQNGYRQINPEEIKCGDFIAVSLNVKVNVPTNASHTPGLYVNPNAIELVGYGAEIHNNTTNPDELFGGVRHQLPAGASATPVSGGNMNQMPGAMPGQPMQQQPAYQAPQQQPAYQQPQYQAPQQSMQPQQPQYPAPAHDFVHNAGMQPGFTPAGHAPSQPATNHMPAGMNVNPAPTYPSNQAPQYPGNPGGMPGMPQR